MCRKTLAPEIEFILVFWLVRGRGRGDGSILD